MMYFSPGTGISVEVGSGAGPQAERAILSIAIRAEHRGIDFIAISIEWMQFRITPAFHRKSVCGRFAKRQGQAHSTTYLKNNMSLPRRPSRLIFEFEMLSIS
jgi:hypothetical protein